MHVTLRQLTIFEAVAAHLSYTRAAEALHLTQPAVSMQIRQLEENIGVALFEILGRRVHMTEAGEAFLTYSHNVTQNLLEAEEVLEQLKGITAGRLRLSVATTANEFCARMLAEFSRRFRGVSISLSVTNREDLIRQLDANERDLVIMGVPPSEADVEAEPFMSNPLVVIASAGHPLSERDRIGIATLSKDQWVLREPGSGTRDALARFFRDHGVTLQTTMEMGSNEALKQVVAAGLGLGLISAHTVKLELETGRLCVLKVEGTPLMRQWHVVHRRGKRLSPVARAFRAFVLDEATSFVETGS